MTVYHVARQILQTVTSLREQQNYGSHTIDHDINPRILIRKKGTKTWLIA